MLLDKIDPVEFKKTLELLYRHPCPELVSFDAIVSADQCAHKYNFTFKEGSLLVLKNGLTDDVVPMDGIRGYINSRFFDEDSLSFKGSLSVSPDQHYDSDITVLNNGEYDMGITANHCAVSMSARSLLLEGAVTASDLQDYPLLCKNKSSLGELTRKNSAFSDDEMRLVLICAAKHLANPDNHNDLLNDPATADANMIEMAGKVAEASRGAKMQYVVQSIRQSATQKGEDPDASLGMR